MANKNYSLVGVDGNAYAIMGYVKTAMKECGHSKDEIKAYEEKAKSGDYYNLIAVSEEQIEALNEED